MTVSLSDKETGIAIALICILFNPLFWLFLGGIKDFVSAICDAFSKNASTTVVNKPHDYDKHLTPTSNTAKEKNAFGVLYYDSKGILRSPGEMYFDYNKILRSSNDQYFDHKGILRDPGEMYFDSKNILRSPDEMYFDSEGRLCDPK